MIPSSLIDLFTSRLSPDQLASLYRTTPPWVSNQLVIEHFRRTVRWAGRHSPFYKKAFADRGIDPAKVYSPADLKDFYTTPDDVAARAEDFLCRDASIVFESSGTSGRNKRVYFSRDELDV